MWEVFFFYVDVVLIGKVVSHTVVQRTDALCKGKGASFWQGGGQRPQFAVSLSPSHHTQVFFRWAYVEMAYKRSSVLAGLPDPDRQWEDVQVRAQRGMRRVYATLTVLVRRSGKDVLQMVS